MSEGTEEPAAIEAPVAEAAEPVKTETPETAEAATEESTEEAETTEETEEESKPKRESQNKRLKRKNQYLQSEILRLSELANKPAAEPDKAPREEDFGGDWGKYIAATAAFEAAKAVKGSLAEDKKTANQARVAELQSEVLADFNERTEDFKAKAPDFDAVVSAYWDKGGRFSDAVRELVVESDVGPQLAYHIAKHPSIANKINSLPPLQAAKEIARLEDTLSKPSTKATKASPPITSPKGGAGPSVDPRTGPDDMQAFASWLRKDQQARSGRR